MNNMRRGGVAMVLAAVALTVAACGAGSSSGTVATSGLTSAVGAAGLDPCMAGATLKAGVPVVAVAVNTAQGDQTPALAAAERSAFATVLAGTFGQGVDLVLFTYGATPADDTVQVELLAQGTGPNPTYVDASAICQQQALSHRFAQVLGQTTPGRADLFGALRVLHDDLSALAPTQISVVVMGPGVPAVAPVDLTNPDLVASDPVSGAAAAVQAGQLPRGRWDWYFTGLGSGVSNQDLGNLTNWWWCLAHQAGGSLHEVDPTGLVTFPAPAMDKPLALRTPAFTVSPDTVTAPAETLFAFASAELSPEADPALAEALHLAKSHPHQAITVTGYTDSIGSVDYNDALSGARATSVVTWMTAHGVDPARLTAVGAGATGFIATNDTPEGRAQNRRVIIRVGAGMAS